MSMTEERAQMLYDKALTELNTYLEDMKTKPPQEIINSAYQIVNKQDLLMILESAEFIFETDVSKNAAYIPPAFGSQMADVLGSGERLTPNLVTGGYLETGGIGSSTATVLPPQVENTMNGTAWSTGYTAVASSLYYKDGSLGTLSAPSIGLSTKIYQGTDSAAMRKGAGHFTETSIWDGNVAFAGHNRGVNNHFGKIHTLKNGDTITLATTLGTRR